MGDFLNYAKAQNKILNTIAGVIIYPARQGVPQDIILVPYEAKENERLNDIIRHALDQTAVKGIFTYFQHIRWTFPQLEAELTDWQYINGIGNDSSYFLQKELKLSYGKITFDQTYVHMESPDEQGCGKFSFEVLERLYQLDIEEFPREIGVPKLFEKINR